MDSFSLLQKLTEIPAVSGAEEELTQFLMDYCKNYGEVSTDTLNNIICQVNSQNNPKILITAHKDTVGAYIKAIEYNGLLRIARIGLSNLQALQYQRVIIHSRNQEIKGVLYAPDEKNIFIDLGLYSKAEVVALGILPGDPVSFENSLIELVKTPSKYLITSAGFDNRIGVLCWLQVLEEISNLALPYGFYFIATSMEEWGQKGIQAALPEERPDLAIVLDVTWEGSPVLIGSGPVITLLDKSVALPRKVRDFLQELARESNIPLQFEVMEAGATDAMHIVPYKTGVPTICSLVATKNPHTPVEIAEMGDIQNNIRFVIELIKNIENLINLYK